MPSRSRTSPDIKLRVWLERDGESLYGDGKHECLERIAETGSLRAAAEAMGMSYRDFWGRIRRMEQRLGFSLLDRHRGGAGGGGVELSDRGRALVEAYRDYRREVDEAVKARAAARRRLAAALRPRRRETS